MWVKQMLDKLMMMITMMKILVMMEMRGVI